MSIDENIYNEMKSKLFEFFEDDTLERIMDNLKEFTSKYIETKYNIQLSPKMSAKKFINKIKP